MTRVSVAIPPNTFAGQPFVIQAAHGQQMVVHVPPGCQPGQVIQVDVPAAPVLGGAVAPQTMQRAAGGEAHGEQNI